MSVSARRRKRKEGKGKMRRWADTRVPRKRAALLGVFLAFTNGICLAIQNGHGKQHKAPWGIFVIIQLWVEAKGKKLSAETIREQISNPYLPIFIA
jgi:hypothetical protein